ncbi:MAG TPA: hypothetical protein VE954_08210 [Oligoflexus sp.]|uniref:hypothetical protein n=1 Tax=Oligoflexus sp. TaxID=1971216 RepID=UPI002D5217D8|nr:hypothetical protein [Oligoflexus sp.]HYX33086.1 hypothetical protein [Oligoflexus sp.]
MKSGDELGGKKSSVSNLDVQYQEPQAKSDEFRVKSGIIRMGTPLSKNPQKAKATEYISLHVFFDLHRQNDSHQNSTVDTIFCGLILEHNPASLRAQLALAYA